MKNIMKEDNLNNGLIINDVYNLPGFHKNKSKYWHLKQKIKKILPNTLVNIIINRKNILRYDNKSRRWVFFNRLDRIVALQNQIQTLQNYLQKEVFIKLERQNYDIVSMLLETNPVINQNPDIDLITEFKVASESADHIFPEGTAVDNTRSSSFCRKCETFFGRKILYMDLGCSGGGLVFDFLINSNFAVGVEGSDFSLNSKRAEWRIIPNNLFTADITKPFSFKSKSKNSIYKFDVISSWEVLEHIESHDLKQVFKNVSNHLKDDGIFVGSIGIMPSFAKPSGEALHVTVEKPDWWMDLLDKNGFKPMVNQPFEYLDFCRGVGNGYCDPNYRDQTVSIGFHFVVQKKEK
jgi:2-polyprenyl-3-methyl-5-hydroxy-6-metoxy-1,4-benzoquinol methylase